MPNPKLLHFHPIVFVLHHLCFHTSNRATNFESTNKAQQPARLKLSKLNVQQ